MSALSVPFHFTTTFLVALGAFAGVWLAVSRPDFSPRGWARFAFGLGWALLAAAETIHGAQILTSDVDWRLQALRSGAYLLLLLSLAIPLERARAAGEGQPGGGREGSPAGRWAPRQGPGPGGGRRRPPGEAPRAGSPEPAERTHPGEAPRAGSPEPAERTHPSEAPRAGSPEPAERTHPSEAPRAGSPEPAERTHRRGARSARLPAAVCGQRAHSPSRVLWPRRRSPSGRG